MKKEIWLKVGRDWKKEEAKVKTAIESGNVTFFTDSLEIANFIRKLAKSRVALMIDKEGKEINAKDMEDCILISKDKVPKAEKTGMFLEIKEKADEQRCISLGKEVDYLVVKSREIIPLENIIAEVQDKKAKVISIVSNEEEAKLHLKILERGVDGICIDSKDLEEIKNIIKMVRKEGFEKIDLVPAEIIEIKKLELGSRVCIDTCSMLKVGEGALIGSQANAFFLVHSETIESPYVETRPFRVNAGAVHCYVLTPDNRTKYLSELKAGDEILIVDWKGNSRVVTIGRIKLEERPMLLIKAKVDSKEISIVLQNAETIRLVDEKGKAVSVVNLKVGNKVLVHLQEGGRHFGKKIEETIIEK